MVAFELVLNGKRTAVIGLNGGLFNVMVSTVDDGLKSVQVNASGMSEVSSDAEQVHWPLPELGVGDELTIRIVETDLVDQAVPI